MKKISKRSRKKWTASEDQLLRDIVEREKSDPLDWRRISDLLLEKGVEKSPRQVRERWVNQLDPHLEHDSLNSEDHVKLLDLHSKYGNSWKTIAKNFEGRSDNGIKNQFFAMIRKSLRKARKSLKQNYNTTHVNEIKPKMLSKFLTLSLNVPKDVQHYDKNFPWSAKNPVSISEFLRFFLTGKFSQIEPLITNKMSNLIDYILQQLENVNDEYVKARKFSGKKNRRFTRQGSMISRRKTEPARAPSEENNQKSSGDATRKIFTVDPVKQDSFEIKERPELKRRRSGIDADSLPRPKLMQRISEMDLPFEYDRQFTNQSLDKFKTFDLPHTNDDMHDYLPPPSKKSSRELIKVQGKDQLDEFLVKHPVLETKASTFSRGRLSRS